MGVFDDIHLNWQGSDYVIPANKVMGAIARIEDVITLTEIYEASQQRSVKFSRVSSAYAAVLRFAGATVTDEEVYAGMFAGQSAAAAVRDALTGLLSMMIPPSAKAVEKEAPRGNASKAGTRSSNRPSRSRSASGA
jgi:hypothetical protein